MSGKRYSFSIIHDHERSLTNYPNEKEDWVIWACSQEYKKPVNWAVRDKIVEELIGEHGDALDNTLMWVADQFQMTGEIVILIQYKPVNPKAQKKLKKRR